MRALILSMAAALAVHGAVPILFEPNLGQASPGAAYVAQASGYRLVFEPSAAVFDFGSHQARLTLRAARPVHPQGELPAAARRNYFVGDDPSRWLSAVPTYNRVRYDEMLPGVDLVFRASPGLEFDLELDPGASPASIEMLYEGFRSVEIATDGDLLLETSSGVLRQHVPSVFQGEQTIAARYRRTGPQSVGLELGAYDASRPLLIDPRISYATFLGGSTNEALGAATYDADGNYYIAAISDSANFPRLPAAPVAGGGFDIVVTKFDRNNTLLYSTVIGGSTNENVFNALVTADGSLYLAAATASTNFPVPPGSTLGAGAVGSGVIRLNAAGVLNAVAFLPIPSSSAAFGLALDAAANVWLTGGTAPLPGTTGVIQVNHAGGIDLFAARINAALNQVTYFTYLGTPADENGTRIAVDSSGRVIISGNGGSAAFPTGSSPAFPGAGSFVVKLDPSANRIVFATYVSGGGGGAGLVLDGENVWTIANSTGANFTPTTGAMQSTYGGGATDAALVRMNASDGRINYASYYGGPNAEFTNNMIQDPYGNLVITGTVLGAGLPVSSDALQSAFGGGTSDAYLLVVDVTGARVYASYLGGVAAEAGAAVALDSIGNPISIGTSSSNNFPITAGAFQAQLGGAPDIFIARVELIATTDPALARIAIQNAASFRGGPVAPGEIVTVYPRNAGPAQIVTAALTADRRIATLIGGTRVLFDDVPSPMVYTFQGQISAVVPYEVRGRAFTRIMVEYNGVRSRPMPVPVTTAAPGIFTASGGVGQAAALNEDGSFNMAGNAAQRGSVIVFFATGEGETNPAGVNGRLNEFARLEDFPKPLLLTTVTIGGQNAEILYGGGAPGFLAGLMQFNVRVPAGLAPGAAVELLIGVGGIPGARGVTIAIR